MIDEKEKLSEKTSQLEQELIFSKNEAEALRQKLNDALEAQKGTAFCFSIEEIL